ncbi:hypothetical protein ACHAWF_011246 [Thalassiosira exigua]
MSNKRQLARQATASAQLMRAAQPKTPQGLCLLQDLSERVQAKRNQIMTGYRPRDRTPSSGLAPWLLTLALLGNRGASAADAVNLTSHRLFADALTSNLYSSDNPNGCSSALGVSMAFSLLYPGTQGNGTVELQGAMGFPLNKSQLVWEEVSERMTTASGGQCAGSVWNGVCNREAPLLKIANSVWLDDGSTLSQNYSTVVGEYASQINFTSPQSPVIVNEWVENSTNGLIDSIVDPTKPLYPPYVLIAINSIYLKAAWRDQFSKYRTNLDRFYKSLIREEAEGAADAHFMNAVEYYPYSHSAVPGYQVVELPFASSQMSMIFVLPQLENSEAVNSTKLLSSLDKLQRTRLALALPKFKFESNYDDELKAALEATGIDSVFREGTGALCGIFEDSANCNKLIVDKVIQKTVIDVNEEGVEAAAVTALAVGATSVFIDPNSPYKMVLDHPFQFFIFDKTEEVVLFEGRVGEPGLPAADPTIALMQASREDETFWIDAFDVEPRDAPVDLSDAIDPIPNDVDSIPIGVPVIIVGTDSPPGGEGSTVVPTVPSDTSVATDPTVTDPSSTIIATGKCDASDLEVWIALGGTAARPEHSNFCSRTYNGGCFLDAECIETCFREEHGYSEECATCFGVIPSCSITSGCMMVCMSDSLSPECATCNAPCVEELDACTGFPSATDPTTVADASTVSTSATDPGATDPAVSVMSTDPSATLPSATDPTVADSSTTAATSPSSTAAPSTVEMDPAAHQAFADELTSRLHENANECSSALGVSMAFSLVYPGCTGVGEEQVREAMGYPEGSSGVLVWEKTTDLMLGNSDGCVDDWYCKPLLEIANSVWLDDGDRLNATYESVVGEYARQIDFESKLSPVLVNEWVEESTNGLIDSIVDESKPLFPPYVLLAINSIYFKAAWRDQFEDYHTTLDNFYSPLSRGMEAFQAHFMHAVEYYPYSDTALRNHHVIGLPFDNSEMSMIFVTPNLGYDGEALTSTEVLAAWDDLERTRVALALPKFKFESKYEGDLEAALQDIGIVAPFEEGTRSLCGIFENLDCDKLVVDKVIQKTAIDVNEEGVEAAAVTMVGVVLESAPAPDLTPPMLVMLDRPFQFFIYDAAEGLTLFEGRVGDPGVPDDDPGTPLFDASHADEGFWTDAFGVPSPLDPPAGTTSTESTAVGGVVTTEPAVVFEVEMNATAHQEFADELVSVLYENDNECSSALGVSMAFSLVYPGCTGEGEEQVRDALRYPEGTNAVLVWERTTTRMLDDSSGCVDDWYCKPLLEIANSVWLDVGDVLNKTYRSVVGEYAKQIDFRSQLSPVLVNEWVEESTNGLIDSIVDESKPLFPPYALLAINSIYFKASWRDQFEDYLTNLDSFYASAKRDAELSKTPFMHAVEYYQYSHTALPGHQVVELPFDNSEISMVFVLPRSDGGGKVTSIGLLAAMDELERTRIALSLPKFKFESTYDDKLMEALRATGIEAPFEEGTRSLCGIFENKNCDNLIVDKVIQKTVIDVNEEGVEAAAVTMVGVSLTSLPEPDLTPPVLMVLDHPFQFWIYDRKEGLMLFEGRVGAPGTPDAEPGLLDLQHSDEDFWSNLFDVEPVEPPEEATPPDATASTPPATVSDSPSTSPTGATGSGISLPVEATAPPTTLPTNTSDTVTSPTSSPSSTNASGTSPPTDTVGLPTPSPTISSPSSPPSPSTAAATSSPTDPPTKRPTATSESTTSLPTKAPVASTPSFPATEPGSSSGRTMSRGWSFFIALVLSVILWRKDFCELL